MRKVGHLNIKINVFDLEVRVMIGWLANTLASQPIRTRASKSNTFVFMLRWLNFLKASIFQRSFYLLILTSVRAQSSYTQYIIIFIIIKLLFIVNLRSNAFRIPTSISCIYIFSSYIP